MRIGFVSTRLAGTDGVSLETRKWATLFERLGHEVCYCAGQLERDGPPGQRVPEMHFNHPEVVWIHNHAFGTVEEAPDLRQRITAMAERLHDNLARFVSVCQVDVLVAENALAIPMNVPLGLALQQFIAETGIPTIAHHHDLWWERERFETHCIGDILEAAFPPRLPNICHVVINTLAQRRLREKLALESALIPNIFDFSHAAPGMNGFARDLRGTLGLTDEQIIILQPTRVIRRKGIERSIELVRRLRQAHNISRLLGKEPVLLITHRAGDEGLEYLHELRRLARSADVPLIYAATRFAPRSNWQGQRKVYSLWDAYVHADFVTYPSRHEGFGNALLEAIYFRLPIMINRYNVYVTDIAPLGLELIEINDEVTDEAVEAVIRSLIDPVHRRRIVEFNYSAALEHFSYEAVMPKLEALLARCAGRNDE